MPSIFCGRYRTRSLHKFTSLINQNLTTGMLQFRNKPSFDTKHPSFVYQTAAVNAVKDLEFAALFHEQGLGKTKIALDLVLNWLKRDIVESVIIVTKKGLIKNWEKEIAIHTGLTYAVLSGKRVKNSSLYNRPYQLYLTHYESVNSNKIGLALLLETRKFGVILDEAHRIKKSRGLGNKGSFRTGV